LVKSIDEIGVELVLVFGQCVLVLTLLGVKDIFPGISKASGAEGNDKDNNRNGQENTNGMPGRAGGGGGGRSEVFLGMKDV